MGPRQEPVHASQTPGTSHAAKSPAPEPIHRLTDLNPPIAEKPDQPLSHSSVSTGSESTESSVKLSEENELPPAHIPASSSEPSISTSGSISPSPAQNPDSSETPTSTSGSISPSSGNTTATPTPVGSHNDLHVLSELEEKPSQVTAVRLTKALTELLTETHESAETPDSATTSIINSLSNTDSTGTTTIPLPITINSSVDNDSAGDPPNSLQEQTAPLPAEHKSPTLSQITTAEAADASPALPQNTATANESDSRKLLTSLTKAMYKACKNLEAERNSSYYISNSDVLPDDFNLPENSSKAYFFTNNTLHAVLRGQAPKEINIQPPNVVKRLRTDVSRQLNRHHSSPEMIRLIERTISEHAISPSTPAQANELQEDRPPAITIFNKTLHELETAIIDSYHINIPPTVDELRNIIQTNYRVQINNDVIHTITIADNVRLEAGIASLRESWLDTISIEAQNPNIANLIEQGKTIVLASVNMLAASYGHRLVISTDTNSTPKHPTENVVYVKITPSRLEGPNIQDVALTAGYTKADSQETTITFSQTETARPFVINGKVHYHRIKANKADTAWEFRNEINSLFEEFRNRRMTDNKVKYEREELELFQTLYKIALATNSLSTNALLNKIPLDLTTDPLLAYYHASIIRLEKTQPILAEDMRLLLNLIIQQNYTCHLTKKFNENESVSKTLSFFNYLTFLPSPKELLRYQNPLELVKQYHAVCKKTLTQFIAFEQSLACLVEKHNVGTARARYLNQHYEKLKLQLASFICCRQIDFDDFTKAVEHLNLLKIAISSQNSDLGAIKNAASAAINNLADGEIKKTLQSIFAEFKFINLCRTIQANRAENDPRPLRVSLIANTAADDAQQSEANPPVPSTDVSSNQVQQNNSAARDKINIEIKFADISILTEYLELQEKYTQGNEITTNDIAEFVRISKIISAELRKQKEYADLATAFSKKMNEEFLLSLHRKAYGKALDDIALVSNTGSLAADFVQTLNIYMNEKARLPEASKEEKEYISHFEAAQLLESAKTMQEEYNTRIAGQAANNATASQDADRNLNSPAATNFVTTLNRIQRSEKNEILINAGTDLLLKFAFFAGLGLVGASLLATPAAPVVLLVGIVLAAASGTEITRRYCEGTFFKWKHSEPVQAATIFAEETKPAPAR